MSTTAAPTYAIPSHGDPIRTLMGSNVVSSFLDDRIDDYPEIWEPITDAISDLCDNWLDAKDEYLETAADNIWDEFSFWSGNTRGSIKYVGKYPETEIEFDKAEWFRPKVLTNLRPRTITVSWEVHGSKHHPKDETRTKTYNYAPGSLKVKITGEDYAPRIPSPYHAGGKIDMLVAVFEEMRDAEFKTIAKRRGV